MRVERPFVTLSDEASDNYILMKQEVAHKDEKIALLEAELAKLKGSR